MARPLRIEFPGALYHVTSRGNGRADIFLDDADRHAFLAVLDAACQRMHWLCYAYCLMSNHYHLVIETPHMWVDFGDFAFFRMDLTDSYMVGGFGVMGWVSADDYDQADIDPLADIAASLLEHMNNDHAEALVLMAHHFGNRPAASATMTAVDRLGFHLQVQHQDELQGLRLAFTHEARSADAVRQVLVQMVQQARAAGA